MRINYFLFKKLKKKYKKAFNKTKTDTSRRQVEFKKFFDVGFTSRPLDDSYKIKIEKKK